MLQVILIKNDSKHLKDKSILRYLIKFFMMLDIRENFISARQIEYVAVSFKADRTVWRDMSVYNDVCAGSRLRMVF